MLHEQGHLPHRLTLLVSAESENGDQPTRGLHPHKEM